MYLFCHHVISYQFYPATAASGSSLRPKVVAVNIKLEPAYEEEDISVKDEPIDINENQVKLLLYIFSLMIIPNSTLIFCPMVLILTSMEIQCLKNCAPIFVKFITQIPYWME